MWFVAPVSMIQLLAAIAVPQAAAILLSNIRFITSESMFQLSATAIEEQRVVTVWASASFFLSFLTEIVTLHFSFAFFLIWQSGILCLPCHNTSIWPSISRF